jgi:hypothetical protein
MVIPLTRNVTRAMRPERRDLREMRNVVIRQPNPAVENRSDPPADETEAPQGRGVEAPDQVERFVRDGAERLHDGARVDGIVTLPLEHSPRWSRPFEGRRASTLQDRTHSPREEIGHVDEMAGDLLHAPFVGRRTPREAVLTHVCQQAFEPAGAVGNDLADLSRAPPSQALVRRRRVKGTKPLELERERAAVRTRHPRRGALDDATARVTPPERLGDVALEDVAVAFEAFRGTQEHIFEPCRGAEDDRESLDRSVAWMG